MQQIALYLTPALIFPILLLVGILCFFCYYWYSVWPGTLNRKGFQTAAPIRFAGTCHPMKRKDVLPVLVLTAVYAATAFFQLGSTKNPQSFAPCGGGETWEVTLSQEIYLTDILYYAGLGTGDYNV